MYVANGYMIEGKENPAFEAAKTLAFDDIEAAFLTAHQERAEQERVQAENKPGSFEKLMGFMGGTR